jgi:hypothetical protein
MPLPDANVGPFLSALTTLSRPLFTLSVRRLVAESTSAISAATARRERRAALRPGFPRPMMKFTLPETIFTSPVGNRSPLAD